jgi:hypothetical protein
MEKPEIKVECPCCKAKLVVDAQTGGVIHSVAHKNEAPSFEAFLKADKNRAQELESKFAESKKQEEGRQDLLQKKWEWAKKNKDKLPDAPLPGIHWD